MKLLTRDRLHFLEIDPKCCLCAHMDESTEHLFFSCSFTRSVWERIRAWVGLRRAMSTLHIVMKWIKKESRGTSWHNKAKRIALVSTVYHIWMARNKMIFEDLIPHVDSIVRRIKTHIYNVLFSLYPNVLFQYESLAVGL